EKQVVKNLRNHLAGRTVLMITHRLSTLIEADKIVIMHAGRVDEAGTHQQLMSQKGRYFALYQSQFGES
ncbi:ABC transporter ATP-binding protein, partial [bacterium]|nr:ABC transporter ATP-binding protein [bacterium]